MKYIMVLINDVNVPLFFCSADAEFFLCASANKIIGLGYRSTSSHYLASQSPILD